MYSYETQNDYFNQSIISMDDYYREKMSEYADFAVELFDTQFKDTSFLREFVDCIAVEYTEGNKSAEIIFNGLGLKEVHAWALQYRFKAFCESFEETEVN